MTTGADLEISLHTHPEANEYRVEARLCLPGTDAAIEAPGGETLVVTLDLDMLEALGRELDHDAYGEKLAEGLFGLEAIRTFLSQARSVTRLHDPPLPLRLRLRIGASAPELHRLHWELIHDPEKKGVVLATDENVHFSRHLRSSAWRAVRTRPQAGIRALVVIANPSNVTRYKAEDGQTLEPVKVKEEWQRARRALGPMQITLLCSDPALDPDGRPTQKEILAHLRDGYDILYLVAHGSLLTPGGALLMLEDDHGKARTVLVEDRVLQGERVPGLKTHLSQMEHLPRLVVLASCESAGSEEGGTEPASRATRVLAALGPRLAEIGVPAVVAMQGRVTMRTVEAFMPVFFEELRKGEIDGAMAAAQRAARVADRHDWWMPVLFSRLESGRLFSQHGQPLGDQSEAFWTALRKNIEEGDCTPFLGPGVTADLLPTPAEVARELAEEWGYPLTDTHDLARVGQFVAAEGKVRLSKDVVQALRRGFTRSMHLKGGPHDRKHGLAQTIQAANWSELIQDLPHQEIHHRLAHLNLPLYVTTNFDNFMTLALRSKRKPEERHKVRREVVDWREEVRRGTGNPHCELDPPLEDGEQVVLHLFGTEDDPLSMVLTEDDYMDYLANISRDYDYLMPTGIRALMASTTLLFLGYELHDLSLKVILRGLLPRLDVEGWGMKHVAVQVASPATEEISQKTVIDYFQKYFGDSKIDVYWGSAHQFVTDLFTGWQES